MSNYPMSFPVHCPPIAGENGEDHVIDPLSFEPKAPYKVGLISHSYPLHQLDRSKITRVHRPKGAMFSQVRKKII